MIMASWPTSKRTRRWKFLLAKTKIDLEIEKQTLQQQKKLIIFAGFYKSVSCWVFTETSEFNYFTAIYHEMREEDTYGYIYGPSFFEV